MLKLTQTVIFSTILLAGCHLNLNPDSDPNGPSSMTAVINGVPQVFSFKHPPIDYLGLYAIASSGSYEIAIETDTRLGTVGWRTYLSSNSTMRPDAQLNGLQALSGIGQFTVTESSSQNRVLTGQFEFAVVDSSGHDTTFVKSGTFTFNYINQG